MDEPYLGEIRPISFPYAPKGWAFCNGQQLAINGNQALFALLGNTFGGNGQTTFGLPDLRGRVPVGTGQLAGGSSYTQGQMGGSESVTLRLEQIPAHMHVLTGTLQTAPEAEETNPVNGFPAKGGAAEYSSGPGNTTLLSGPIAGSTSLTGAGQGHENRMPVLAINYVIALQGIFPSRP